MFRCFYLLDSCLMGPTVDFLHQGLVYLMYTIYLLLAIVGFFTENDMPQIGIVSLASTLSGALGSFDVAPVSTVPSKEAKWAETTFPELGRRRLEYIHRKADPSTGLVRHSFKVTFPTLKSVVTDPGGPYAPPPQLDYPTAGELTLWVHPRSTMAEREAVVAAFMRSIQENTTFSSLIASVIAGQTVY